MKRFIALYFLFLLLLFILFYAPTTELSVSLNEIQNRWTLAALNAFLQPEQLKGIDIWVNPHYKIVITQACNGMIPILFLYASILAYPSNFKHKIVWMILGYIVFFVVNTARILWVVHITQNGEGHGDFYWSHDIVGNIVLLCTGVGLFVTYIKTAETRSILKNL